MARVTVINDNPEFLELVRDILEDERYTVTLVDGDVPDAIERIAASRPDVLMVDLRMGTDELHGWEIAQTVRRDPDFTGVPILVCSADVMALRDIEDDLESSHAVATLTKPFQIDALTGAIDRLLGEATAP